MTRGRVRRLEEAMDNFSSQLQCAICLCAYDRATSLPCNHCFCEACIHRALELKSVCPICKAPAKKRNLRPDPMIQRLLDAVDIFNQVASSCTSQQMPDGPPKPSPNSSSCPSTTLAATATATATTATAHVDCSPPLQQQPTKSTPTTRSSSSIPTRLTPVASPSSCRQQQQQVDSAQMELALSHEVSLDGNGAGKHHGNASSLSIPASCFTPGQIVQVASRTWAGINKPGGVAWIKEVNPDGTVNVKYVLEPRRENNILPQFVTTANEMMADSTPSRAAKQKARVSTPLLSLKASVASSQVVLLLSGFNSKDTSQINAWAEFLDAEIVHEWTNRVTHLVAKCVDRTIIDGDGDPDHALQRQLFHARPRRWVKNRTLKFLKALVGGRWIVSEDWLRESGSFISESEFEAVGHAKAQNTIDVVRNSRKKREQTVMGTGRHPSNCGTQLFGDCWCLVTGDFVPPSPPCQELQSLVRIGDGRVFSTWQDLSLALTSDPLPAHFESVTIVIVCDKTTPAAIDEVRKKWFARPQLQLVARKAVVSYQWVVDSISEAQLRAFEP